MFKKLHSSFAKINFVFASIILSGSFCATAQTTVWSVNFNNGCAANCIASTYGGWTILNNDGGVNGSAPNNWFVSCAEEGIAAPGCGSSSCVGDASLHISADPGGGGDVGASYNETGASNATYRTAVSPTISTAGRSGLSLIFDFIAYGSAACSDDRAQLRLSTDNGATWPAGYQYCLTSLCCGACNGYSQGQWTTYTLALPAAFANNPNVRIGFNWRNNGNGSGTDPSVAIDDIRITSTTVLPVSLIRFDAIKEKDKIKLNWVSAAEVQLDRYEIERSSQGTEFTKIGSVAAKGSQGINVNYTANDPQVFSSSVFYRLKMIDKNGAFKNSNIIRVGGSQSNSSDLSIISVTGKQGNIKLSIWSGQDQTANISLYDMDGKQVAVFGKSQIVKGATQLSLNVSRIPVANYVIKVNVSESGTKKPVSLSSKFYYTK